MTDTTSAAGPTAVSVAATDQVSVLQSGAMVLATVDQLNAAPNAALAALAARVAALEGKASPNVVLTGAIPVGTVQVGSIDIAVPVPGLLRTDTVTVEIEADLPAGLDLRAVRPDRTRDGYLVVQATAGLAAVALTAPVPIRVVAER